MKKTLVSSALLLAITSASFAQTTPAPPAKERDQNITIHKRGSGKEKMTIVIDGDKVTINGKPADEYKDGDVEVMSNTIPHFNFAAPIPPTPAMTLHGGAKSYIRNFDNMNNAAFLGVASSSENGGAVVSSITKNSPAQKAGLKEGDVITKVGSHNIDDADDLMEAIGNYKPNDKVAITYKRGDKENTLTITLDKNKNNAFAWSDNKNLLRNFSFAWDNKPHLGVRVQDTETGNGVKVIDVNDDDAPAAKAGLKEDDVITEINGKAVQSVKDVKDQLENAKAGDNMQVKYQRGGTSQTVTLHFPKDLQTSDL